MAQARRTFFSLGGPTYIEDPRVQEQQAQQSLGMQQQALNLQRQTQQQRASEFQQRLAQELQLGQMQDATSRYGVDQTQAGFAAKRAHDAQQGEFQRELQRTLAGQGDATTRRGQDLQSQSAAASLAQRKAEAEATQTYQRAMIEYQNRGLSQADAHFRAKQEADAAYRNADLYYRHAAIESSRQMETARIESREKIAEDDRTHREDMYKRETERNERAYEAKVKAQQALAKQEKVDEFTVKMVEILNSPDLDADEREEGLQGLLRMANALELGPDVEPRLRAALAQGVDPNAFLEDVFGTGVNFQGPGAMLGTAWRALTGGPGAAMGGQLPFETTEGARRRAGGQLAEKLGLGEFNHAQFNALDQPNVYGDALSEAAAQVQALIEAGQDPNTVLGDVLGRTLEGMESAAMFSMPLFGRAAAVGRAAGGAEAAAGAARNAPSAVSPELRAAGRAHADWTRHANSAPRAWDPRLPPATNAMARTGGGGGPLVRAGGGGARAVEQLPAPMPQIPGPTPPGMGLPRPPVPPGPAPIPMSGPIGTSASSRYFPMPGSTAIPMPGPLPPPQLPGPVGFPPPSPLLPGPGVPGAALDLSPEAIQQLMWALRFGG